MVGRRQGRGDSWAGAPRDTEALTGFVAQDKIPYVSASYAAALTDPEGASGKAKPRRYNFFYGPSYSDAMRALLIWAAEDWKAKGKSDKPKFVHMGANHPYPNAPKAAGEAWLPNSASKYCRRWCTHWRPVTTAPSA